MHYPFSIKIAFLTVGVWLLIGGIGAGHALAGSDEAGSGPSNEIQVASVSDDADLSRSASGETFEHDSHDTEHESSEAGEREGGSHDGGEGHEGLQSDHSREGDHEGPEGDRGIERDRGGESETGGGDSGGDH